MDPYASLHDAQAFPHARWFLGQLRFMRMMKQSRFLSNSFEHEIWKNVEHDDGDNRSKKWKHYNVGLKSCYVVFILL